MNMIAAPILLVEDTETDAMLFKRSCAKANLVNPVEVVEHGEEAIDYLAGNPPFHDRKRYPLPLFVLLDLKLPRKSGFEVLEWVRAQKEMRRLPVVVLTSSAQTRDINRAYELGANSYLVKPESFESLTDLARALDRYWISLNQKPEI